MKCLCKGPSTLGVGVVVAIIASIGVGLVSSNTTIAQVASTRDNSTTSQAQPAQEKTMVISKDVLGYEMETIDGKKIKLDQYRGKVVMIVNVASKCGLTPQYEGLEALYRKYSKDGLVILGFPANDFMSQEPGTNEEIAAFCSTKYNVTFPMMSKITVKGKEAHPLYQQLAAQPEPVGGEPEWNFDKFIVNRKGEVVARFKPRTTPEDPALLKEVKSLLSEKP